MHIRRQHGTAWGAIFFFLTVMFVLSCFSFLCFALLSGFDVALFCLCFLVSLSPPLRRLSRRQLGLGIAESLSDLYDKLAVSERQLAGAKSAKGGGKKAAEKSRKVQGLEGQVSAAVSASCRLGNFPI